MKSVISFCAVLLVSSLGLAQDADRTPDRKGLDFFEAKIRPVLVTKCYQCHSAKAAAARGLKGGLQLDTRDGSRKGGESGPAVVPGKPDESLIIGALKHESFKMPPKGKLPDSIIGHFVQWIEMGAPDPRDGRAVAATEIDIEEGRKHWSFQPLKNVQPPQVKDNAWIRTDIDRFIRAAQEARQIKPNQLAGARVLLRRAHFDLIGLPPTPDEVEQFLAEVEADGLVPAYGRLIDRLLESPHYGERWARHWLDISRFAESNGYAFDGDRPNAWWYRDFVIKALNEDIPYTEFVRQQIAGDVLAGPRDTNTNAATALQSIAATGYLVAGTFTTQQTQKERERSRYEQLDDMINTLGTSLLGLTVGCARCHSHKYDPLPQHDYYRLAACFADVGFTNENINLKVDEFNAAKKAFDDVHNPLLTARTNHEQGILPERFVAWASSRGATAAPAPTIGSWYHIGPFTAGNFNQAYDKSFEPESEIVLTKTYQKDKLKWVEQPTWEDGKAHNTLMGDNSANYLFRVLNSSAPQKLALKLGCDDAIRVWVNGYEIYSKKAMGGVDPDAHKVDLPLRQGRNELLIKIVNASGPSGFYFSSAPATLPDDIVAIGKKPIAQWTAEERKKAIESYRMLDETWLELNSIVLKHSVQAPKPQLTGVFSAKTRGSTYQFGDDTYKVYFLRRGNADNKQGEASAGFLQVLLTSDEQYYFNAPPPPDSTPENPKTGTKPARIALAEWLTNSETGAGHLLARVIVNRLWHHHFGKGIVATPSDFGTRGERPSHPELLDWLASQLIHNGWQLKSIHRLIMTSAVYMQAGGATESGMQHDPENLLLWRRAPRRLEAEIIRDALLAVSGSLDRRLHGKGTLDQKSKRRSIYFTVKRSRLIPMLQLFDAPDTMQAVGTREESTVAPQALALINSPIVRELATTFSARVRPNAETTIPQLVDRAYLTAFARPPSEDERTSMLDFIDSQKKSRAENAQAETLAVRDFCHILLCMNEFVYVD